jgi:phosphoserine phosphatase RsbU/P
MGLLILSLVAAGSLGAALVWARSARRVQHVLHRVERDLGRDSDAAALARAAFRKDVHTTTLYGVIAVAALTSAIAGADSTALLWAFVLVPAAVSLASGRDFVRESRLAEERYAVEKRAEAVLAQDQLAPQRWADRLAPEDLPEVAGFEVGRVYQAGDGLMAGDFFDVFRLSPSRVAAVIGDVSGHGIEASITAFQAKYLLRVFLRQFRDPGQAIEELNAQMSAVERNEEFISLVVTVFDTEAGTLRYASAGHPPAWLWHEREVRPLRSTGPLLMLDAEGTFVSREIPLDVGDLLLLYTDGLAEARSGEAQFGEERIANILRRDPAVDPQVLCKSLLAAAKDFATQPLTDDVAIVAIRRA